MTAFNVVRFRVKPEGEDAFLAAHRSLEPDFEGVRRFTLFKTGDQTYCVIGEWESFDHIVNARPQMVSLLDSFRAHLEDLGSGLGVTDPISGPVVVDKQKAAKRAAKAKAKKKAKPAKKAAAKKKAPAKKAKKAKRGRR
jgi:antibiotic biosynthesis monooxygenase